MYTCDLLITNGTIITVDKNHTIYTKGYIKVVGNQIYEIGPMEDLGKETPKKTIDATNMAVLPGLIDAHGHNGGCIIKALGEANMPGEWVGFAQDTFENYANDFFWFADSALGAAEHLKFGVTTNMMMCGSFPKDMEMSSISSIFDGAMKTGARQFVGVGGLIGPWPHTYTEWKGQKKVGKYERTLQESFDFIDHAIKTFNKKDQKQFCVPGPMDLGKCIGMNEEDSIKQNKKIFELAQKHNTIIHSHAYEGDIEFLYRTSPEVLSSKTSLTHLTGISDKEIDILAKTGTHALHGPTTRSIIMKYCPVYEMLEKGVNVVITTDGTGPDRSFDMWRDMKIFQILHRSHWKNPLISTCGLVLEMCTIRAAKALNIDHIVGSLETGKLADIILIDTNQPHLTPFEHMPVERLVYFAQGNDVQTVIVDGEIVVDHRILTKTSEANILDDSRRAFSELIERYGDEMTKKLITNNTLWDLESIPTLK